MPKFNGHTYTWTNQFESIHHRWELRTVNGGVHFHASEYKEHEAVCGLEFHRVTPQGDNAPDHINCPMTGGRCWHDGTSLYAMETLWPEIQQYLKTGNHKAIFKILEHESERLAS